MSASHLSLPPIPLGTGHSSEDRLSVVLNGAHDAFVAMDGTGRVTEWNRAAAELFGWRREEVLGRRLGDLIVPLDLREAHERGFARFLATQEPRVLDRRLDLRALHRDGHEFPVELTISAVRSEGAWAFHAFLHDVTERRAAAQRAELLASIVESSQDAMYTVSRHGTVTSWNPAAERLFLYPADEILGTPVDRLVPEHLTDELRTISQTVMDERSMHQHETERRRRDGSLVAVALTVSPLCDTTGEVVGSSSIARDITEQRRAQSELRAATQQFERAFEGAPIGMALGTLDGRLIQANRALRDFLGLADDDVAGRHVGSFTHAEDPRVDVDLLPELLSGDRRSLEVEKHYVHADGTDRWATVHLSLVRDEHDEPLHVVAQFQDITARKQAEAQLVDYTRELRGRMQEDPQTGLATRRELERRLAAPVPEPAPFALALLRIEGLQAVVRREGHEAGGRAVRSLAATVAGVLRDGDRVYRCGSATLAVELLGADAATGATTAARLRANAEALEPALRVETAVAAWAPGAGPRASLLARAEAALSTGGRAVRAQPSGTLPEETANDFSTLLESAREHLGMDVAWVSEFTGGEQVFRALGGDAESFGLERDAGLALDGSLCIRVLDGRLPAAIADTTRNPVTRALAVTAEAGIGAYLAAPIRLRDGHVYGMLCAAAHDPHTGLDDRDARVLRVLATVIADRLDLERRSAKQRRADTEFAGVAALMAALDARDHYTGEHSEAVVELSGAIARDLDLPAQTVAEVEQVALLHDIGKIGIPDTVLQKRGPLSELEWDLMRQHSALGARIVASIGSLAHLAPAVRAEHERWDGDGYPDGLTGTAIPIASRIILAADAYHAMTSDRPYRTAMTRADALAELQRCAGSQFDPDIAAALRRVTGR